MSRARFTLETIGNAVVLVCEDGKPLIVTDPWITGTAYFGSWALDFPISDVQRAQVLGAKYLWISHGHPDHLHPDSIAQFPRDKTVILGKHYSGEIERFFRDQGFAEVIVQPNRTWLRLSDNARMQQICNINQDTILAIEAGDTLILNQNDSPFFGEGAYLRRLARNYDKSYMLALCAYDADMINLFDENGARVIADPEERKPGTIKAVARNAEYLGVRNYCCSSSQHMYVRADSAWANPFRISWHDMQRHWDSRTVRLIEPHVKIDLADGTVTPNNPEHGTDLSLVSPATGDDDWNEAMTAEDWSALERFVLQFETLRPKVDFIEFKVAGDSRRYYMSDRARAKPEQRQRGVKFHVPRRSLMDTVQYGYFDDLLIGNFMRTQLVNMTLYPHFSPRIAKYGGNAKVYSQAALNRFYWHYFWDSPSAFLRYRASVYLQHYAIPWVKSVLRQIGLFDVAKAATRRLAGRT